MPTAFRPFLAAAAMGSLCCAPAALAQTAVAVQGVDDPAARASLIAALPPRAAPATVLEAERFAEEAAERANAWLRSEGYYAGEARPAVTVDPPAARVEVQLGPLFRFAPAAAAADPGADPAAQAAIETALALVPEGAPARGAAVLAAEQAGLTALRDAGFADAAIAPRQVVVDHAAASMQVTLAFTPGARARLGPVRILPEGVLNHRAAPRLQTWPIGAPYTPERLAAVRRAVAATGAFRRVEVALAPAANAEGLREVLVTLEEGRPRTVSVGASWSSTDGFGGEAEWTRRNPAARADALTLSARLAEREQRLEAGYRIPQTAGLGRVRRFGAGLVREDVDPFQRSSASVTVGLEPQSWERDAPSYGLTLSVDRFDAAASVTDAVVASGFGEVRRDSADDPLDPRRGTVLEARVEPSVSTGDATLAFLRATGQGRAYLSPGGETFTLAGRALAGWVSPLWGSVDDLPPDRRFYAGGGGSVRGYAFRSIFPTAETDAEIPPGGQGLLEASLEGRVRLTARWGAAAFIDAATVFDRLDAADAVRAGVGLGVRYDLGFGPLRFDVAAPLNRRDQDNPVAVYVSIGQAF